MTQGWRQGGAFAYCVPPPPPLHPLTSLLNVIVFESESETNTLSRASATARDHRLHDSHVFLL